MQDFAPASQKLTCPRVMGTAPAVTLAVRVITVPAGTVAAAPPAVVIEMTVVVATGCPAAPVAGANHVTDRRVQAVKPVSTLRNGLRAAGSQELRKLAIVITCIPFAERPKQPVFRLPFPIQSSMDQTIV